MGATAVTVPVELTMDEYLHTMYHPDCDFVDGHLEERNLGEFEHTAPCRQKLRAGSCSGARSGTCV